MTLLKKPAAHLLAAFAFMMGCSAYLTREQSEALIDILEILNTAIAQTEEIIRRNPDPTSPYRDLAEKLRSMHDHIDKIKAGKAPYDADVMSRYRNDIIGIQTNVNNPVDRVLGADVFFGPGKYKITEFTAEGKSALDGFAEDIINLQVKKLRALFPDKPLVIVVKAIGYADEIPLSQGFAEELKKDISTALPDDPVRRRRLLNKELSFRRAESITGYIKTRLEAVLNMENVTIADPVNIGMGEEYPYPERSADPPYEARDKRRRICKIHGNVFAAAP